MTEDRRGANPPFLQRMNTVQLHHRRKIHIHRTSARVRTLLGGIEASLFWLLLAACDPGSALVEPRDDATQSDKVVVIRPAIDDSALAAQLGWSDRVPGAEVRLHRILEPYDSQYWKVAEADSAGLAHFPDLLPGRYEILVTRSVADGSTHVLAGGGIFRTAASYTVDVEVVANRRGTLTFSEISLALPQGEFAGYFDHKYVEIYNNGDETIHLDGMIWGVAWDTWFDYTYWPCSETIGLRRDSSGVWAQQMFRFPGEGTDYPLAPGEAVVLARLALDHSEVDGQLPDLRAADFEFAPEGSADNPDVPNLIDVGLTPFTSTWPYEIQPQFIADGIDLEGLPRYTDPVSGDPWVQIPAGAVHDTYVGMYDYLSSGYTPPPPCDAALHPLFERLPGPAGNADDFYDGVSMQRKPLYTTAGGQIILQDTNTSMADFVKLPRSLGTIPDPPG